MRGWWNLHKIHKTPVRAFSDDNSEPLHCTLHFGHRKAYEFFRVTAHFPSFAWRYDESGLGVVRAESLLKKLGIEFRDSKTPARSIHSYLSDPKAHEVISKKPESARELAYQYVNERTVIWSFALPINT